MLKFKSIKTQITAIVGVSLFSAILAMLIYGVIASNTLYNKTSDSLVTYSEQMVNEALQRLSSKVGKVNEVISDSVRISVDMATTQEFVIENNLLEKYTREESSEYAKYILEKNPNIVGSYYVWEQGAIDKC